MPSRVPEDVIEETRQDFIAFLDTYMRRLGQYPEELRHIVRTLHQDFHRGVPIVTTLLELQQSLDHEAFGELSLDPQRFRDAVHHFTSAVEALLFARLARRDLLDDAMIVALRFPGRPPAP